LTVAANALMSLVVACIAGHLLLRFPDREAGAQQPGLRALLWLFVGTMAIALAAGYVGFAGFLAFRFLAAIAVVCVLGVGLAFIDALFSEVLTGDTPAGRRIATAFGVTPRGLELTGTLLSAALRIVLVVIALPLVLGPWSLYATDVLTFFEEV